LAARLNMYRQLIEWSRHNPIARRAFDWVEPRKRRNIMRALGGTKRAETVKAALAGKTANLSDIEAFLVAKAVPLRVPLVLISQVQRSGGTLLSQLFDGHPALAAHPHELKIGHPTPESWPPIDPALDADTNFQMLFEPRTIRFLKRGYTKGERDTDGQACFNVPRLQYRIFSQLYEATPPRTQRDIVDFFFTAYFRAWLNYQGDLGAKRFITGFAPRFADGEASVAAFFACYPDGRLIQIVRDPRSWLPSAKHHGRAGIDPDDIAGLLSAWTMSAQSAIGNRQRHGDRVIVLAFENLVGHSERTMRYLARELGIDYDPILLEPTFNGVRMTANSSFPVANAGLVAAPLQRESLLTEDERRIIERNCIALYQEAVALDRSA
jgi:hypothetical protein